MHTCINLLPVPAASDRRSYSWLLHKTRDWPSLQRDPLEHATPRSAALSFGTGFWRCRMLIERAKPSRAMICFHCCASSLVRVISCTYINECLGCKCEKETNDSIATAPLGLMRIPVLLFGGVFSGVRSHAAAGVFGDSAPDPAKSEFCAILSHEAGTAERLPVAFEKSIGARREASSTAEGFLVQSLEGSSNPCWIFLQSLACLQEEHAYGTCSCFRRFEDQASERLASDSVKVNA